MRCLGIARKVCLVAGKADCKTKLSSFDAALMDAGIHDYNLIPVSSILAKGTKIVEGFGEKIEKGSFVPAVLSACHSNKKGEGVIAVIGAAMLKSGIGFVVELSESNATVERIKERINNKFELIAKARKTEIDGEIHFAVAEHTVKEYGCAVAAAVYVF